MAAKGDNPRQQAGAYCAGLANGINEIYHGHNLGIEAAAHVQLLISVLHHGGQRGPGGQPAGDCRQR